MTYDYDEIKRQICAKLSERTAGKPQSIDQLVLQMIESRSMFYAFQETPIEKYKLFNESLFFESWAIGQTYTIICIIGKLLGKNKEENSLRRLWGLYSPAMYKYGAITRQEFSFINDLFEKKEGFFNDTTSKAVKARNHLIAHNNGCENINWNDIDNEIRLIIRAWSLLTSWAAMFPGASNTFHHNEIVFKGLTSVFSEDEVQNLGLKREEYIKKVKTWAKTFSHKNEIDSGGHAFSTFKIISKVK